LYCNNLACNHSAPVAIAPVVIRWGPDASSEEIGALLEMPQGRDDRQGEWA
jgi:hypothetical protein